MAAAGTTVELHGRDQELGAMRRALDGADRPVAVVVEGEAGIGKTTLWEAAIELCRGDAWRVLSCRPTSSEADLSFSALGDLLAPVADECLDTLPAPQARALAAALLISEPGPGLDVRALGVATLRALQRLAHENRVLVAIDDAQWLDPGSTAALAYAVRRLRTEPVALLETVRSPHPEPLAVERSRSVWAYERLELGPLGVDDLHSVIRSRLRVGVTRSTMKAVHESSGGNPFFAVELVRSLPVNDGRVAAHDVALPQSLLGLVETRIGAYAAPVRRVLATVAALATPTISLVEAAFPGASSAIALAERYDVLRLDGVRIRFTHPLLAGAAVDAVPSLERAQLQLRLAQVVEDGEQRGLHLAHGTLVPDERVAAELEEIAASSAARGASAAAATLLDHAARLTPPALPEASRRRRLHAARHHFAAGDQDRARELFAELRDELPAGHERARVLVETVPVSGEVGLAISLLEQAIAEADGDLQCLVDAHRWLGQAWVHGGDLPRGLESAREAARLARGLGEDARYVQCLGTVCMLETYTARITPGLLEQAVQLEARVEGMPLHHSPVMVLGSRLLWSDRLSEGRVLLELALARATDEGDEPERAISLFNLVDLEIRAGDWSRADTYATALYELDAQIFGLNERSYFVRSLVSAHLGRIQDVRTTLAADESEALGAPEAKTFFQIRGRAVLGFLELSLGNAEAAAHMLGPLPGILEQMGYRNPGVRPVLPDAIEALIGIGELDEARAWATKLDEQGRALDIPWARATAARSFGLAAAAAGDASAALASFEAALAHHERSENPFERARTLLALGAALRRAKHKRDAREALTAALEAFDVLGAALWAERTSSELARIGGRPRSDGGLTPTEHSVAELVAEGRTNKEIAAALFVSVRTVESHVRHIREKLGARSRAELAGRIARGTRT